jgi:hypothetical protein
VILLPDFILREYFLAMAVLAQLILVRFDFIAEDNLCTWTIQLGKKEIDQPKELMRFFFFYLMYLLVFYHMLCSSYFWSK